VPPAVSGAPWRPLSRPSPAASTPISATSSSGTKAVNMPMAFEPPPTQAIDAVGQPARAALELLARLVADEPLQVAHDRRVRRRADGGAQHVVGVADVRDPVADRRRRGLLERLGARVDRLDARAQQLHALHVGLLAADVLGAHEDDAVEVEQRAGGRRGDAVLARAGLGDDARLAHALGQQRLADRVVDLVRAGVVEVLALEPDLAAGLLAEALGQVQRRGAPDVVAQQPCEIVAERLVLAGGDPGRLELGERRHQGLGDVLASVGAVAVLDGDLGAGAHAGTSAPRRRP
jgi:hypothetical protein